MKAYFDRTKPFYIGREAGFYSTPVDIPEVALKNIESFRSLLEDMETRIMNAPAPERGDVELADHFVTEVRKIFKTRKQDNG